MTNQAEHGGTSVDLGIDTPVHVQVNATRAEDDALIKHLLGITMIPTNLEETPVRRQLAHDIADRIFSVITPTRSSISYSDLHGILDKRLQEAVERMDTSSHHPPHIASLSLRGSPDLQRIRAVADAVRQSVPSEMLNDFMERGGVANVTADEFKVLTQGTDNTFGAALAASILSIDDTLKANIKAKKTEPELKKDLQTLKLKTTLAERLSKLETPTLNVAQSWKDAYKVRTASGPALSTIKAGENIKISLGGETFGPINTATREQVNNATSWVMERVKKADEDIAEYRKIASILGGIAELAANIKGSKTSFEIMRYFHWTATPPFYVTKVKEAEFGKDINVGALLDEIRHDEELDLKKAADSEEEIKKIKDQLKEVKTGKSIGPTGNEAQHLVVTEYLKKHQNMNDLDAKAGANYLLGRGMLDVDVSHAAEEVAAEMYGDHVDNWNENANFWENLQNVSTDPERRSQTIVGHVAEACHIHVHRETKGRTRLLPRKSVHVYWSGTSYPNLCTAYFALKKLYEGQGPSGIRLQKTEFVQKQMKEISKILLSKHLPALLKDFGPSLGLTDEKQKEMMKAPNKEELIIQLEALLNGDAPAKYTARVDRAIEEANKRVDWWRRSFFGGENWGILRGSRNKASLKNLAYGNEYASMAGIYYRVPKKVLGKAWEGTKHVGREIAARKKGIGWGALAGTLLLPGLGTLAGAAIGGALSKGGKGSGAH